MRSGLLCVGAAVLAFAGFANAAAIGFTLINSSGTTVYGATHYTCPGAPNACTVAPGYILNNVTGRNDILATPGNGYQVANPVIGNNVAETPDGGIGLGGVSNPTPYVFGAAGGISADGSPFGAGLTANNGGQVGFALSDATHGCCSTSYMITSWEADYQSIGAWNAPVDAWLGLGGVNLTGNDFSVASLITSYSINGAPAVQLTPMLLAVGGNCNDAAAGDVTALFNAACGNGGQGGAFEAAALAASAVLNLNAGDIISFVSTLSVYADPASIGSIIPDELLLSGLGLQSLPAGTLVGDAAVAPAPEPGTLLLLSAGLVSVAAFRRRRA